MKSENGSNKELENLKTQLQSAEKELEKLKVKKLELDVKTQEKELGLKDFKYFFEEILQYEKKLSKTAHQEIIAILAEIKEKISKGEGLEKLMLLPRGFWKSTVLTVAGVNWLLTIYPNLRILLSNALLSNAEKFLDEIKRNFKKEKYVKLYGDVEGEIWRNDEIRLKTCTRSTKEMTITIGSPTTSLVSQHFDVIIGDDLVNRESINTIEQIEKTKQYAKDLIPLGQGDKTIRIFIGTRWHFADLYSWLIDKGFPYVLKSIFLNEEKTISSFPEEFPISTIQKLKEDCGVYDFSCQYENNPVNDENATFKESWLQNKFKESYVSIEYSLAMIDMAQSKDGDSDYTGVVVIGIDTNGKWYVIFAKNYRYNITERIELIFDIWTNFKKFNITAIGIEQKAFNDNIKPLFEPLAEQRGVFPTILELKDRGRRKEARIMGLVPRFEYKRIMFKENPVDDTKILIDQLMRFPRSKNDDLSDALAYGQDMVEEVKEVIGTGTAVVHTNTSYNNLTEIF